MERTCGKEREGGEASQEKGSWWGSNSRGPAMSSDSFYFTRYLIVLKLQREGPTVSSLYWHSGSCVVYTLLSLVTSVLHQAACGHPDVLSVSEVSLSPWSESQEYLVAQWPCKLSNPEDPPCHRFRAGYMRGLSGHPGKHYLHTGTSYDMLT